jgi:hypothetical protein
VSAEERERWGEPPAYAPGWEPGAEPDSADAAAGTGAGVMSDCGRARAEGEQIAAEVVGSQADAGMSADRIDRSAEDVLAARFDSPNAESDAFWSGYDTTAAIYAADLRDLDREAGAIPREHMTRVIRGLAVVPDHQADYEAGQ